MSIAQPTLLGNQLLEETFRSGPSTGILPYRAVILDGSVSTPNYGSGWLPPIKYCSSTFANGERVIGCSMGPVVESDGALVAIAQNKSVRVRTFGTAPFLTDTTTGATAINAGDGVAVSTAAGAATDGTVKKAAKTANLYDANQHIVGISYVQVSANSLFALVKIQPADV